MGIENGINYALRVLKPVLEGRASAACVRRSAEEGFVNRLHAALNKTVWMTGCDNWYIRGPGGKTWNGMSYPWNQAYFWYASLFPVWRDWEYSVSVSSFVEPSSAANKKIQGKTSKSSIVKRRHDWFWCLGLFSLVGGLFAWVKNRPESQLASLLASQISAVSGSFHLFT
jgi:hypothetical protein